MYFSSFRGVKITDNIKFSYLFFCMSICISFIFISRPAWGLDEQSYNLTSCSLLNNSGSVYYLQNDIYTNETCFVISVDNVTLDCQGHELKVGAYVSSISGISLTGNYTLIKNCSISGFYYGINATNIKNSTFKDVRSYYNKGHSIYLTGKDNLLSSVNSFGNQGYGIYLVGSGNILNKIHTYINNAGGAYLDGSNSSVTNIESYDNHDDGIHINSGSDNKLINISINGNKYTGIYAYLINGLALNIESYNNSGGISIGGYNNTLINLKSYDNEETGFFLERGSFNNILSNISIYNNSIGLFIGEDYYGLGGGNKLRNVTMSNNYYNFILEDTTTSFYENDIDASNTVDGKPIYYLLRKKNAVFDSSTNAGVFYCIYCNNISLKNLNFTNNDYGIHLFKTNNSIINNVNSYNQYYSGIFVDGLNNTLTNIVVHDNTWYGVALRGPKYATFSSRNILINLSSFNNNYYGIVVSGTENTLIDVRSYNNSLYGIITSYNSNDGKMASSTYNTFKNLNVYGNGKGFVIYGNYNNITNLSSYNNTLGFSITEPDSYVGYAYYSSYNNTVRNISLFNNTYNFYSLSTYKEDYDNDIDTSNTVDGKPIYYSLYKNNTIFDSSTNAGVFYCFNCINITLKDLSFTKNGVGIFLLNTNNSRIENVTLYKNEKNLYANGVHNTFDNIDFSLQKDEYGFLVAGSNNTISNIYGHNNTYHGLSVYGSNNNILNITVCDNGRNGFLLMEIYSNNNAISDAISCRNGWSGFNFGGSQNKFYHLVSYGNLGSGIYFMRDNNLLSDSEFYNNGNQGIFLSYGSDNLITRVNSYNNLGNGITLRNELSAVIEYSNIYNNTGYNIGYDSYNNQNNPVNARYNYWGYTTAEEIDAKIYDDDEDPSFGEVDFTPWLNAPGSNFEEQFSEQSELTETIMYYNISLRDVNVSGDMSGILNFSNFEIVEITTGPFAGKGFSKGDWKASLENSSYEGQWQGFLLYDSTTRKIYLRGSISGYFKGIVDVEGYLTESFYGSGVYDKYHAIWKIARNNMSAILELNGILVYNSFYEFPSTKIHMLQTSMKGNSVGDYTNNLDIILTNLRIADESNPFYGEGFSTVSYSSDMGSGQGWLYTSFLSLLNLTELKGMFTSPLNGVVDGILDESSSPTKLIIGIGNVVGVGLPPMADLEVEVFGPGRVSPGQTAKLLIEYQNNGFSLAEDTVVVYDIPEIAEYVSSSGGGIYIESYNEIIWKLEKLLPGSIEYLSLQIKFPWGLPAGEKFDNFVRIGTSSSEKDINLTGISPFEINRYLNLHNTTNIIVMEEEDIDNLLNNDSNFSDMFNYSISLGFNYTNMSEKLMMDNNASLLVSIMSSDIKNDTVFVSKFSNENVTSTFLIMVNETDMLILEKVGGIRFNYLTNTTEILGEHFSCAKAACMANCILNKVPDWTRDNTIKLLGKQIEKVWKVLKTSWNCVHWQIETDPEKKIIYRDACLKDIAGALKEVPYLSEGFDVFRCIADCSINRYSNPGFFMCLPETTKERCKGSLVRSLGYKATYSCNDKCEWELVGMQECLPRPSGLLGWGGWCNQKSDTEAECVPDDETKMPNADLHKNEIVIARDPNIKYGPEGNVTAGQGLNYTIEYENEGEGIAFGVYFTDTLDKNLDDSTLEIGSVISTLDNSTIIAPSGIYDKATRTIMWFVGEVGPGEGGYANINVSVNAEVNDSQIINYAIVYFPSVPEETKTNGIASTFIQTNIWTIPLIEGWNLISLPLQPVSSSIKDILQYVTYKSVFIYKNNSWYYYFNETSKSFNETLPNLGIWVNSLSDQQLEISGNEFSGMNLTLSSGWNLIGYPRLNETLINETLKDVNYTIVYSYNGSWKSYVPNRTFTSLKNMKPGYGYWVKIE